MQIKAPPPPGSATAYVFREIQTGAIGAGAIGAGANVVPPYLSVHLKSIFLIIIVTLEYYFVCDYIAIWM